MEETVIMKKFLFSLCMLGACGLLLAGCKKKEEADNVDTESVVSEVETETEEAVVKEAGRSLLTGENVSEEVASKRPLAVMVGNTVDALPQYGVGQADILYEVPVEGGLTRLMAIFGDYTNVEKIGSVRSCRHYFAYFAMEFDAIYLHYGQAAYAEPLLNSGVVDDLNGLDGKIDSLTFYRDSSRKQPHNAFVTPAGIDAGIAYKEYNTTYDNDFTSHYNFATDGEEVTLADGVDAAVAQPGYVINKPWFVYHEDDGLYYRFQYNDEHMDGNTNTQLSFKNIIFQYTDYAYEPDNKYLDVSTTCGGSGKYITNGKAIDITWTKADENSAARYFDATGKEITINQGKTCVCIVLNDSVKRVAIYSTEADFNETQTAK